MPEYILLVNHHTIEKICLEALSPRHARERAYGWDWEDADVIKSLDGGVDYVEILTGEDAEDSEEETLKENE